MTQKTKISFNKVSSITILFSFLTLLISLLNVIVVVKGENYVQEACSVTRYPSLCEKSLASYSNKAKKSPHRWARVGVSVTISEVKLVSRLLHTMMRMHGRVRGRKNRAALGDCVECIQDALDNLNRSLGVLRRLSVGEFNEQMGDVLTWLSAALTDEDTCLDGFEGLKKEKQITRLCNKVQNVSYITSNALALVNKLATTGLEDDHP